MDLDFSAVCDVQHVV